MKKVYMNFGQTIGYVPEHPERTARSAGKSWDSQVVFQTWPNRASMAKSIRMQQAGPSMPHHWKACVPLTETEGY